MAHRLRTMLVVLTMALPAAISAPPAAAATVDTFILTGSGTISPGLTAIPAPQSISFDGTATVVGTDGVLATYNCDFVGTDLAGSVAEGVGTMSGGCGPWRCDLWVYIRVGPYQKKICVDVRITFSGMNCIFTPHDVNPTTSYSLVCHGFFTRVP